MSYTIKLFVINKVEWNVFDVSLVTEVTVAKEIVQTSIWKSDFDEYLYHWNFMTAPEPSSVDSILFINDIE